MKVFEVFKVKEQALFVPAGLRSTVVTLVEEIFSTHWFQKMELVSDGKD